MAAGKRQTDTYWVTKQVPDHTVPGREIELEECEMFEENTRLIAAREYGSTKPVRLFLCVKLSCVVTLRLRLGHFPNRKWQ